MSIVNREIQDGYHGSELATITKERRCELYSKMMARAKWMQAEGCYFSFCGLLCSALPDDPSDIEYRLSNYPELIKHRPFYIDDSNYWWPVDESGNIRRLNILAEAIALTKTNDHD